MNPSCNIKAILMLGLCASTVATPLAGQDVVATAVPSGERLPSPGAASVTIVAVRSLAPGTRAVVQREAGSPASNAILVDASTSIADLHAALAILRHSRDVQGDSFDRPLRIAVPATTRTPRDPLVRARFRQLLMDLRAAPEREVTRVGRARTLTIPLTTAGGP